MIKILKPKKLNPLDLEFLQVSLQHAHSFLALRKEEWLGGLREPVVIDLLEKLHGGTGDFERRLEDLLLGDLPEEVLALGSRRLMGTPEAAEIAQPAFEVVLQRIKSRKKESEIQALSAQVRLTQSLGDSQEQIRLLQRLKELRSQ